MSLLIRFLLQPQVRFQISQFQISAPFLLFLYLLCSSFDSHSALVVLVKLVSIYDSVLTQITKIHLQIMCSMKNINSLVERVLLLYQCVLLLYVTEVLNLRAFQIISSCLNQLGSFKFKGLSNNFVMFKSVRKF